MRLDKWLKVSRIIKRRTVAKEVCDAGKIFINDRPAKAGTEVKAGDELTLQFGSRTMRVRVLATPDTISADQAHTLYQELQ
ncbi:MAG TPA: RNA-binding S4 domain-containing protein [Clostridia bacterium]|nr:RNA-binding S4 domain-containing protein [Clostridia bacterium]